VNEYDFSRLNDKEFEVFVLICSAHAKASASNGSSLDATLGWMAAISNLTVTSGFFNASIGSLRLWKAG